MLPFFGTTAIVIAALTAPSAPASTDAAQAAPVQVPVVAAAPSRRRRHQADAVAGRPAGQTFDDAAIEQHMQLRVLMPALSGDGGG
jgi:hypothetical protein